MAIVKSNGRKHLGVQPITALQTLTSPADGSFVTISDVGIPCLELVSSGSEWVTMYPQLLGRQHTAQSCDATNNDNTLFSLLVPRGVAQPNGSFMIRMAWSCSANTNSKLIKIKIGNVVCWSTTINTSSASTFMADVCVRNRNSTASQVWSTTGAGGYGPQPGSIVTSSENLGNDKTFSVVGRKVEATDTLTLEYVEFWKMK